MQVHIQPKNKDSAYNTCFNIPTAGMRAGSSCWGPNGVALARGGGPEQIDVGEVRDPASHGVAVVRGALGGRELIERAHGDERLRGVVLWDGEGLVVADEVEEAPAAGGFGGGGGDGRGEGEVDGRDGDARGQEEGTTRGTVDAAPGDQRGGPHRLAVRSWWL